MLKAAPLPALNSGYSSSVVTAFCITSGGFALVQKLFAGSSGNVPYYGFSCMLLFRAVPPCLAFSPSADKSLLGSSHNRVQADACQCFEGQQLIVSRFIILLGETWMGNIAKLV